MAHFKADMPLRYGDCDPHGIAYFPSYVRMLAHVLEDFWASLGIPFPALVGQRGIGIPTVDLNCKFRKMSRYGDLLHFSVCIERIGRSSLILAHEISCDSEVRWTATQTLICTSIETSKSISWPDDIRDAFKRVLHEDAKC